MPNKKMSPEMEEKLLKRAKIFLRLFTSPDGQKVLEDLEGECNPDVIFNDNPHRTSYNTGKRDVISYIKLQMRVADNARRTELEG